MITAAAPRPGLTALFVVGPILLASGVVGAIVEWVRLTTPSAMPTLPVGVYTGYRFAAPSYALNLAPLYVFGTIAVVGAVLLVAGFVRAARTS